MTKDKVQKTYKIVSIIWLLYNSILSLPVHSSNLMLHLWQTNLFLKYTVPLLTLLLLRGMPFTIFQDSAFLWSLLWATTQNTGPFHSLNALLFHTSLKAPIKIYYTYHNGWNIVDAQYLLSELESSLLTFTYNYPFSWIKRLKSLKNWSSVT